MESIPLALLFFNLFMAFLISTSQKGALICSLLVSFGGGLANVLFLLLISKFISLKKVNIKIYIFEKSK